MNMPVASCGTTAWISLAEVGSHRRPARLMNGVVDSVGDESVFAISDAD